jgi:hypothetical protein
MRSRVIVAAMALIALPASVHAQQARMDAQASASADVSARGAQGDGREGFGHAGAIQGSGSTEARLATSRDVLEATGRTATSAEIEAGAGALRAGAEREDLARIRDRAPDDRPLTASLEALANLSARGLSSAHAAAVVSAHLSRGASDAAIDRLGATASTASALNASLGAGSLGGAAAGIGVAGAIGGSAGSSLGGAVGIVGSIGGVVRH